MMTIRPVVEGDRALYLTLSTEFYSGEATLHEVNPDYVNRTFDECVKGSPYASAYILEQDGRPAGYAQFSFTWSSESGGLVVWLEELYVRDAFRGQKLGSQFLEWMLREYQDASRIRLEATHENAGAIRLYQRYGFQPLEYTQLVLDKAPS